MTAATKDLVIPCPPGHTPDTLLAALREAVNDAFSFRDAYGGSSCNDCTRGPNGMIAKLCARHVGRGSARDRHQDLAGHLESLGPAKVGPATPVWVLLGVPEEGVSHCDRGGIRIRARNCLLKEGIRTVEALTRLSRMDLMDLRNFGEGSLGFVEKRLADCGMALAPDPCVSGTS